MTTRLRSVAPVQSIATSQASCASWPEPASLPDPGEAYCSLRDRSIAEPPTSTAGRNQRALRGRRTNRNLLVGTDRTTGSHHVLASAPKPFSDPRKTAIMEDGGSHGTKCTDPYYLRVKAISSERGAFSDVHFRVTGGNLLRPAHGQLRYRRPRADKGRSDIRYRPREASPCPRSSGNGVEREPAAHVTGARLPNYPRGSA
jgi:hypothetical protein